MRPGALVSPLGSGRLGSGALDLRGAGLGRLVVRYRSHVSAGVTTEAGTGISGPLGTRAPLPARTALAPWATLPLGTATFGTATLSTLGAVTAARPGTAALGRSGRAITGQVAQRHRHVHGAGQRVLLHEQLDRGRVLGGGGQQLALRHGAKLPEPGQPALRRVGRVGEQDRMGHAGSGAGDGRHGLADKSQIGEARCTKGGHGREGYAEPP
jgi:hypothetical protein